MSGSNPLSSQTRRPQPADSMMQHAKAWQHVSTIAPHELPGHISQIDYILPILGALAGNPKVTSKDVIKATASAAADGKVQPSQAVSFISQMPADPEKLQPWLRTLYAANLSAAVHMKAAALKAAQAPAEVPQQGAPPVATGNPLNG